MPNTPPQYQELLTALQELDTTRDRFSFLIELGEDLPIISVQEKTPDNKLKGCASNAWIVLHQKDKKWYISGDAEAQISKGMLGFLSIGLSGLSTDEIMNIDVIYLEKNEIFKTLSPARNNGFISAVEHIKKIISN